MPVLSKWMLRSSLVCFLAGFTLGAAMLAHKAVPIYSGLWALLPVHIELLIFGWIIQLTLGTAYWILPRPEKNPSRLAGIAAIVMALLLNLGILTNIANHLLQLSDYLWLAGRLMELASVLLFIALHWRRVLSFNS